MVQRPSGCRRHDAYLPSDNRCSTVWRLFTTPSGLQVTIEETRTVLSQKEHVAVEAEDTAGTERKFPYRDATTVFFLLPGCPSWKAAPTAKGLGGQGCGMYSDVACEPRLRAPSITALRLVRLPIIKK